MSDSINHFNNLINASIEDFDLLDRIMLLSMENRLTDIHHRQLNNMAQRYNVASISVENFYSISTEGFFDFISGIFVKLASWVGLTVEKTNEDVANAGKVEGSQVIKTNEVKTHMEKLMDMTDGVKFTAIERFKLHEITNGSKDGVMLTEFGSDAEVAKAKAWVKKVTVVWKAWNSMLIGGRATDDDSNFTLGMAIREIKLISSKGVMNADGVREVFTRNFDMPQYLFVPGKFDETKNIIIKNIEISKAGLSSIDKYMNGHLPDEPSDMIVDMDRIFNEHKLTDLVAFYNEEREKVKIDDKFINDYLPKILDKSNDMLTVAKVKIDRELLAAIRPMSSEANARSYIKQFDSKFNDKRKNGDASDQKNWDRAENTAVRTTMRFGQKVVRDYTMFIRDMLKVQRMARHYVKFCETLTKLDI